MPKNLCRYLFLLGSCLLGMGGLVQAQSASEAPPTKGNPVVLPRSEYIDLTSKDGIKYRIFVSGPAKETEEGSPVIYFSDGNNNFPIILAAAQRQVRDMTACVVVGIGYVSDDLQELRQLRSVDLTPPTSADWAVANAKPFSDLKTGGNDRFLEFIQNELKPVIERKYKINRQRQTLFGHSFGGLFTLHVLFNRPESFQTYVAASPSIWWNDHSILKEEQQFLERFRGKRPPVRLLLTVGELEQSAVAAHSAPGTPRRGPPGRAVDSVKAMTARLTDSKLEWLRCEYRMFAEEHHGSVVLPAASRGVRFALEDTP